MIVRTRVVRDGAGASQVEIVAATADAIARFRSRFAPPAPTLPQAHGGRGRSGPFVIALVGPTGAGKTTTAAKLAVHPDAFGGRRVGLLTLDTYRVGALEQITTYADVARLPLEVVYDAREATGALGRLLDCDVVIVDTPGRGPRDRAAAGEWRALLAAIAPDEVHLVLPAALRADVAAATRDAFASCGTTHLLLAKLDEVPGERGVAELAAELALPGRWVTDGQDVPTDLRPAAQRLLASFDAPEWAA
jgi:flagellar biosynthesis protein FlhF